MSPIADRAAAIVKELLRLLGVSATNVDASEQDGEIVVNVTVSDEDSGLLIGYHGETLSSFQYLLGQVVNRGASQWMRVLVNMNDYRQERELQLKQMAQNAAVRAVSTGDEIEMPYLTPAERRIIHLELSSRENITTYSEGEARNRRLIVAPKR